MTLKPLGDCAWLVEFPGAAGEDALRRVTGLAEALEQDRPAGVLDVVPSFASVAVHFSSTADAREIRGWIGSVTAADGRSEGAEKRIPVCYGGEDGHDLAEVAALTGLTPDEVVALHSGATYTVAAVGFTPGFPYLTGLPERLRLPRRNTPRLEISAGSVAIAGGQAGIYPIASPGGWHVLGRTDAVLFDPAAARPALFQPGDRLRFVPVPEIQMLERGRRNPVLSVGHLGIEVIEPGAMTTVQDLGRPGYRSSGVSPGGAVDRHALRVANLMVGNEEGEAALEICMSGPVLRFHEDSAVALVADTGRPRRVPAGETLDCSKRSGSVRAYLAVAGGLRVPDVLGSAATDPRAGFGGLDGRSLIAGDFLEIGIPGTPPLAGNWYVGREAKRRSIELRFLRGVQHHWFSAEAAGRFRGMSYELTPRSDRMGARLVGPPLELTELREMVSQPVASGSVQVPPDGQPIVLLAGCQTIGGYPQIGHVISVDLPHLARAWPGTRITFREVTWEQARGFLRREELDFARLRTGLDLLK